MKTTAFAAALAVSASLVAGSAYAASNAAFLKTAIQGDNAEIQMGQLAEQKGGTQNVRQFGQTLVTDHTKAKDQAMSVAQQLGVKAPSGIPAAAHKEYQKLQGMSGASFDREFASFMVKDHRKVINQFQRQAKSGSKATAALATKQLPTLRKHLQMAERLTSSSTMKNSNSMMRSTTGTSQSGGGTRNGANR